jgi:hypothetical protein
MNTHSIISLILRGGLCSLTLGSSLPAADMVVAAHYEWADSLSGPWTAVPRSAMSVAADGTTRIISGDGLKFFRIGVRDGGTAPVLAFSSLDPAVQQRALESFEGIRRSVDGDEDALDWDRATIAPFVVPVFSPWNTSGAPDAVELKILPPVESSPGRVLASPENRDACTRGYLMLGTSTDMPPVVEFATRGETMSEKLLSRCGGSPVSRIVRYAPTYIVGEDTGGDSVASLGHHPVLRTDVEYTARAQRITIGWDSENPSAIRGFDPQPEPPRFTNYRQFRQAYVGSEYLRQRREWRKELFEFDALAATGRAPAVAIPVGGRESVLTEKQFTEFVLDSEEEREPVAEVTLLPGGGAAISARTPGSWRLTLRRSDGTVARLMVNITGVSPRAPRGGSPLPTLVSKTWKAIKTEDQPRYSQALTDDAWCQPLFGTGGVVGCGPVAAQMLYSWWDRAKGVTSLYYKRNGTTAEVFSTMRISDAPLDMGSTLSLRPWYHYWHDACDVICGDGAGATPPEELGEAFIGYAQVQASALLGQGLGAGGPLIGAQVHWEADVISDDWDESGIRLAESIKAGRPGIALYYEMWHYMLGYAYKRWRYEYPNSPWQPGWHRLFKCNMGWGEDFCWLNAYDIDGCWLGRFWQKNLPPAP